MTPAFVLLIIGLIYIVLFGGLSIIRREGLSVQFAFEAFCITILLSGLTYITKIDFSPILFLILLYLITMRTRLLVDMANSFARRENYSIATSLYSLALKLFPDPINRLMVFINQAVSRIKQGDLDGGIQIINNILTQKEMGYLGIKTEAACYYNLAIAYRRKGLEKQSLDYFDKVVQTWPVSVYGRKAMLELKKNKADAAHHMDHQS